MISGNFYGVFYVICSSDSDYTDILICLMSTLMAVHNVTYDIPSGNYLLCISCDEVLKNVPEAIDHTAECHKKNRLARKYDGQSQIEKIKGSVTWTRANIAHMLDVLKKKVSDLGKAKAHYRTYELGKVHDEITIDLAAIIGPGITRYQMTRKWNLLQRRALQYERQRKKLLAEGMPPLAPPFFHPSVKEIMRCVEEEKIKYLKEMEHSEKSYTLKIKEGELEIPEELCVAKDDNFEFSEAPSEETSQISPNEDVEGGSMVLKRSSVLSILNQLEEGVGYGKIIKTFGITASVLSAIEQNGEAIAQGAQRCSLCRILLSSLDDVVAHEIECSKTYQQLKDNADSSLGGSSLDKEDLFVGFLPETVERLVDIILKHYPKFSKGIDWSKVTAELSCMQRGVTAVRCSQKWNNLLAKCRRFQRLDDWAKKNNHSHNIPLPDFYDRLMPYAESHLKTEPSEEGIERFLGNGPSAVDKTDVSPNTDIKKRNSDLEDSCEGRESEVWNDDDDLNSDVLEDFDTTDVLISNLDGIDMHTNEGLQEHSDIRVASEQHPESSSTKLPTSEVEAKSASVCEDHLRKKRRVRKHINHGKVSNRSITQGQRIQQIETKLDDVLGLLDDLVKENQRLTKEAEIKEKTKDSQEEVAEKLEKLTQVFVTAHHQNLKLFQSMTKMWERHHKEHQTMMRALITEMSCKNQQAWSVKKRKK